ncbi:MAG: hypothetical protein ISS31_01090 [Kiritimatiellae bacterium]|nr:hypothetical protein [Kiritimatiellia bacterium]
MQNDGSSGGMRRGWGVRAYTFWPLALGVIVALYLLAEHYVKAYSDPIGFLHKAEALWAGAPVTERAFVYPALLGAGLKALGFSYVFLFNLPFVLLLLFLVWRVLLRTLELDAAKGLDKAAGDFLAFVGVALFVVLHHELLLELVNPFREPLSFALVLISVLSALRYEKKRSWLSALLCGLWLGLATSVRETCILVAPPIALYAGINWWRTRDRAWGHFLLLAAVGGVLGLAPFFLQNYMHSGQAIVPGYAANRVQLATDTQRWDIPVPGMSMDHFASTGTKTMRHFLAKYTGLGVILVLIAVLRGGIRKDIKIVMLLVSAVLLNTLFYSCYWYMKERYLLVIDLFLLPLVILGIVPLAQLLSFTSRRWMAPRITRWFVGGAYALVMAFVVGVLFLAQRRAPDRLQVWHSGTLRQEMCPHLQEPYSFVGKRHHCMMLAWLLGGTYDDMGRRFERIARLSPDDAATLSIHLASSSASILEKWDKGNVYTYEQTAAPLLKNWFDFAPIFSCDDLSVPLDHYGNRMNGVLYQVKPWSDTNIARTMEVPADGLKNVLAIDPRRIWDSPERSFCSVHLDGEYIGDLTNGLQFIHISGELLRDRETVSVSVRSDAPLPSSPYMQWLAGTQYFDHGLGASGESWYYPHLSESLVDAAPLKTDGCLLFSSGTVSVPRCGGQSEEAFAELLIEAFYDRTEGETGALELEASGKVCTYPLPGRRQRSWVNVPLGQARGVLQMVPVALRTSFPSYREQKRAKRLGHRRDIAFVKVCAVRLSAYPVSQSETLEIDVGAENDVAYVAGGFHPREKHNSTTVRWTTGRAQVQLPLAESAEGYSVRIESMGLRAPGIATVPSVEVDGRAIEPGAIDHVHDASRGGRSIFSFDLVPEWVNTEGRTAVTISGDTWSPSEVSGSPDRRELGFLLDRIVITPK